MSSIDHDHESESADAPAEQIAVDGKAGSDIDLDENLRSDAQLKDSQDTPHHARSNSVKKPTTFKAVSVTKNFLAKAGTPSSPATRINGDTGVASPGVTAPPAPRPRLVAKAASGVPGTGPNKASFGPKNGASGPDPMQVWNRNRAAPQPTQKHFTDEELKQQYGIHLATRLQADGDGKEAKWADIDDDEDDWAPEAIEWNDGTKIDLTANNAAILAAEQAAAEEAKQRQEEEEKAKSLLQKSTTTVGPNATVLKPRSAAQPKTGGLVLKTPSEKPSLVSKPSAPTPVRSPWAQLPPVDKVPPIAVNPEDQDSAARPQGSESFSNAYPNQPFQPPTPALEIAADSFSRNRGDAVNGHSGQLYNAQSGRYEPAATGRRGSVRKDQNFRPPSVLQRGDTRGPLGPSEAFQTRSSQSDQAPWARRRSSNVSGDSAARRNSIIKSMPNGVHEERRGSQQSQALQSPTTPGVGHGVIPRDGSPGLPLSAVQSPAMRHAQIADSRSGNESPNQTSVDIIAQQKQTMKEKREMAIKRKQEEEAREEAAKKERIRLKMEAMGMPPLEDKKDSTKKEVQKSIEKRPVKPTLAGQQEDEKTIANQEPIQVPTQPQVEEVAVKAPPKPPQPNASGAPQQYGMMKVHGTTSANTQQPDSERLHNEKTRVNAQAYKDAPPGLQPKANQGERLQPKLVNGNKIPEKTAERTQEFPNQHQIREQPRQQPWNQIPNDQKALAGAGWSTQAATRETSNAHSNVWGAPNARSLGNGAFDRSVQRPQSRQQDKFASPTLAPIGPPKHLQTSRETREPSKVVDARNLEDFQTMPTFPPTEGRTPASAPDPIGHHLSVDQQKPIHSQYTNVLQARPTTNHVEPATLLQDQQKSSVAAWGSFHNDSSREEALKRQQHAAKLADEARRGIQQEVPQLPIMTETWRQVKVDQHSTQRSIIGVERGQAVHQISADLQTPAFGAQLNTGPPLPVGMGRGSRFFPTSGRGVSMPLPPQPAPFAPGHRRGSSPPPPDSEGHPAFVRDNIIVRVSLPLIGPKPKVKLPPSMASPAQSPSMADVQPVALRAISQPLVNNPSWQDRFNGLLGVKKTSPERTFVRPIEPIVTSVSSASNKVTSNLSASKEAISSPIMESPSVAISLPRSRPMSSVVPFRVQSKEVADEEELFIPEAGSLPVTQLPPREKPAPWGNTLGMRRGSQKPTKFSKEVDAASKEDLMFANMIVNGTPLIFINLHGMSQGKSKPMARGSTGANGVQRMDSRPEHHQSQQQHPRNFSGGANPPGKAFKSRVPSKTGVNSPRPATGALHPKSAHQNSSPLPSGRSAPTVSAAGGWTSTRPR